jgi:hypothetical protein
MMKQFMALCCFAVLLAACGGSSDSSMNTPMTAFYVSPHGNDSNPGTLSLPLLTLAQARAEMEISGHPKLVYLRGGTYSNTALKLSASDSGQTWSYYPPDGYDSAILDGGSSSSTTGGNPITIDGGSNITIDGLTIRNFQQWGVGIHGGQADSPGGFEDTTAVVSNTQIMNSVFDTGYTSAHNYHGGGGVWQDGNVTGTQIANNVFLNQYTSAIRVVPFLAAINSADQNNVYTGLTIENNAIMNVSLYAGDGAAIYLEDQLATSTNVTIKNNFIRDYQENPATQKNITTLPRDVAIYLDSGASNVSITGNVIGNTANAIPNGLAIGGTQVLEIHNGMNVTFSGNIADLGDNGYIVNMVYQSNDTNAFAMTGNDIEQNIFIGNWSGPQVSYALGEGPLAYVAGGPTAVVPPTLTNNLYFNYGGGVLSTQGNQWSDAAPITAVDPLISGTTYALAANSPAFSSPLGFPPIVGNWGPPGYTIPATGTPPSP